MKILIPDHVGYIIDTLMEHGYEAYAVGGCVRDTMLGKAPEDWDITTSASPSQVKSVFRRTVDTGIAHGTVTVLLDGTGYEVTTYRVDGEYEDGRHPKSVKFTASLLEDLKRRDFTINAMAYNPGEGLIDAFGGMEDLEQGIIRCVGDARERFTEDALRILRAVRFSAQLGFGIEDKTVEAIRDIAPNLRRISKERIQAEITKLLLSDHPGYFLKLYECGITAVLMPEFDVMMNMPQNNKCHCYDVGRHTLAMLEHTPKDKILRWTALLHDIGKISTKIYCIDGSECFPGHAPVSADIGERILRDLKMDNLTVRQVTTLIRWHSYHFKMNKHSVRLILNQVGMELFPKLLEVIRADTMAKSEYIKSVRLEQISQVESMYKEIIEDGDCISLKMLAVGGNDLIRAGVRPGKELGDKLNELLTLVLENPELNTKEKLLSRI